MEDQTREKIEKIIKGIGSPCGEGATYQTGSVSGHLDKEDAKIMADDLEALIQEQKQEMLEEIQKRIETWKPPVTVQDIYYYLNSLKEEGK